MDVVLELAKSPAGAEMYWLPVMLILLKRALESGLLVNSPLSRGGMTIQTKTLGIDTSPRAISLSQKGRDFVAELGLHEM